MKKNVQFKGSVKHSLEKTLPCAELLAALDWLESAMAGVSIYAIARDNGMPYQKVHKRVGLVMLTAITLLPENARWKVWPDCWGTWQSQKEHWTRAKTELRAIFAAQPSRATIWQMREQGILPTWFLDL